MKQLAGAFLKIISSLLCYAGDILLFTSVFFLKTPIVLKIIVIALFFIVLGEFGKIKAMNYETADVLLRIRDRALEEGARAYGYALILLLFYFLTKNNIYLLLCASSVVSATIHAIFTCYRAHLIDMVRERNGVDV
jgi:hypothetical protein